MLFIRIHLLAYGYIMSAFEEWSTQHYVKSIIILQHARFSSLLVRVGSLLILLIRVYNIERNLSTPAKFLYPNYEALYWLAGAQLMQEVNSRYY